MDNRNLMVSPHQDNARFSRDLLRFFKHVVALSLLWCILTASRWDSWLVGGPTVLLAAIVAMWLNRQVRWHWSLVGLLQFVPYFFRCSLLSGIDVAWRSLHPLLPIDPQLLAYRLRLPDGAARVFFMNVVNLLPGTLSADLSDDVLSVHVIDGQQPKRQHLARLEQAVAALFAIQLETAAGKGGAV
jgi:multicomponent Na+:H+ antiporter subunit E